MLITQPTSRMFPSRLRILHAGLGSVLQLPPLPILPIPPRLLILLRHFLLGELLIRKQGLEIQAVVRGLHSPPAHESHCYLSMIPCGSC